MSVYAPDYADRVVADRIKENVARNLKFIREARAEAAPVIANALKIRPAGNASSAAIELRKTLDAAEKAVLDAMKAANTLARDDTTRPDVLGERWRDLGGTVKDQARDTRTKLNALAEQLESALGDRALPRSGSDAAALLARQEIDLALDGASRTTAHQVASDLAARGGEVAAQIASPWGRLRYLKTGSAEETYVGAVRKAAIGSARQGDDEGAALAAEALDGIGDVTRAAATVGAALDSAASQGFGRAWSQPVHGIE